MLTQRCLGHQSPDFLTVPRTDWKATTSAVTPRRIRILSVESHPVFREGIRAVLARQPDAQLVAEAASAAQGIAEFRRNLPDVTLMERWLPDSCGLEALAAIRAQHPEARIVMFTSSDRASDIQRAIHAGASAYVLKSAVTDELLAAVRSVYAGRKFIPTSIATRFAEHLGDENLTPRELEVLRLICNGQRNKQIAGLLAVAESTIDFHVKNLIAKLQANDRAHAAVIAIRRGLLQI